MPITTISRKVPTRKVVDHLYSGAKISFKNQLTIGAQQVYYFFKELNFKLFIQENGDFPDLFDSTNNIQDDEATGGLDGEAVSGLDLIEED